MLLHHRLIDGKSAAPLFLYATLTSIIPGKSS